MSCHTDSSYNFDNHKKYTKTSVYCLKMMLEEDKKTERKTKRFTARLKSSKGIICTDKPQTNIILCNVGQATGLIKDDIHKLIKTTLPTLSLPKFVAEKGETHSFLFFSNIEDSILFYKECNGKMKIDENGALVYMSFVENENVPNVEVICKYTPPEGLLILHDFITPAEEEQFLKLFDFDESSNLKNRQVKHYGYEFRYGSNDVDLASPLEDGIPKECDVLWRRLKEQGMDVGVPDQLTVNMYKPGQGIPSHVDKHSPFGDTILSVSLGSSIVMDWRHSSGKLVAVVVPARSMLIMKDEARYDWQHGIHPRTWDPVIEHRSTPGGPVLVMTGDTCPRGTRLSLTFRWTRQGPCQCAYKTMCDTNTRDIEDGVASRLEDVHVHQVYEEIAEHFSTTRHKPWPRVVEFMERVPPGSLLLDLGAGNGKNILARDDIFQLAGERCGGLLAACQQRQRAGGARADCLRLDLLAAPLRERCADAVLCIAVIHHFSTRSRRLQAVSTISRLLRPGGRALITVWSRDQTKSNYLLKLKEPSQRELRVEVAGINLPVHENRTQFQHQDLLVPWKLRNVAEDKPPTQNTYLRYYHVFEEGELDALCEATGGLVVENSFYEEGNWCVVCRKK